jgi:hypothetical protein
LTFTGRWHRRATGSVWCGRAVNRGRRRQLAHREVGDDGRSGPGGPQVGYKLRMGRLMLQGRWRKKKRGKNRIGPLEGLGQKEIRVEIRDQIQTCCRILVFEKIQGFGSKTKRF